MQKNFVQFIKKVSKDFPDVKFKQSEAFYWNPYSKTIGYAVPINEQDYGRSYVLLLLHELAHARLKHKDFRYDIKLLEMETEAWSLVQNELAKQYEVEFDETLAQNRLNTYRNWHLERAKCPSCEAFGFQQKDLSYLCWHCQKTWKPNDNRFKRIHRQGIPQGAVFCNFDDFDKLLQF